MKETASGSALHVVVIGSGVAGTAAGIAAASLSRSVVLLDGGSGASTLATGALDHGFWQDQHIDATAPPLSDAAKTVLTAMTGYDVPMQGCRVVTMAGLVRRADGRDRALLDVGGLGTGAVGVVACRRPGWSARELASAWGEGFAPLEATLLRYADESLLPDGDLAARHDDAERLGWLAARLRIALTQAGANWSGIVLPPMLGLDRAQAEGLSRSVGLPCGEAVGSPGGPAGLRFENGRDRALSSAGVAKIAGRASTVEACGETWRITTQDGQILDAHSVVFATGGLIGGGIAYAPSEAALATAHPSHVSPPLRLTLNAPLTVGARGRALEAPGSLFGFAPELLAPPFARDALIERAGVLVHGSEPSAPHEGGRRGLFAAGDLVADTPRTWLGALWQGAHAGEQAARGALSRVEAVSGAKAAATSATPL
jgi:glycerol-3-phosphate dehydrogenase subunit B